MASGPDFRYGLVRLVGSRFRPAGPLGSALEFGFVDRWPMDFVRAYFGLISHFLATVQFFPFLVKLFPKIHFIDILK